MPPVPDSLAADDVAVDVDGGASESSAADDSEEESKLSKGFGNLKNKAKAAADKALDTGKRQRICIDHRLLGLFETDRIDIALLLGCSG